MEKRGNGTMKLLLVVIYLLFSVAGLTLMKLGGNTGTFGIDHGVVDFNISWISLIGFACYLFSFLLYTKIVVIFDLSYITPIATGVMQILILVVSFLIFKEKITLQGLIGALVIIAGVVVMNWKKS